MEPSSLPVADHIVVGSIPNTANAKLRLMCSYGGHIVPRPHDKSLFYAGGDTRIVAVDRRTTASTLSSLTAHLSRSLYNNRPFFMKYQLPNEDLDSLISVTTDEDLYNMLEEHDRISCSPKTSRIRLFLFPSKPESVGSVLFDPKAESWFCDALKSAKIIHRGESADSGLVKGLSGVVCVAPSDSSVEAQIGSLSNNGGAKHVMDLSSMPESIVLETSSSFGSTSSSASMSNLPLMGVHGDDGGVNVQDKKVKVHSPASLESENCITSVTNHPQSAIYEDPVHLPLVETRVSPHTVESESTDCDVTSRIQLLKTVQVPSHAVSFQSDQMQPLQDVQYTQAGARYIPQYSPGQLPISSYYPMYYSPLQQQTQNPYQQNQHYPVYLLPVRPAQSYSMPVQCNLVDNTTTQLQPQMHQPSTMITHPLAYKEAIAAAAGPQLATKICMPVEATTLVHVPSNQSQQPLVDLSETHYPSQFVSTASIATASYSHDYEDDLASIQIYKTQPSLPALLSQYQTMTTAGTLLLSEASNQLHADNSKQHVGNSQLS